ncbi:MAG: Rpn family recombination-promoting nuclease/putative transposase [Muribaculaceae bacterium]|nr:Rpn family recombination-promoting nuclease/putative transposase [Muribaculaceae bacterium]
MENNNLYIRFDWAIKHILRDKANFDILEGFISVLIGEEVKIIELLESESNQEDRNDKFNRVDIKAMNSKGHLIIVEVQLTRQLHYLQRILYGTSKAVTEHISLGDKYDQIKKVYSISILYCDYGQGDDYVYHGQTRFRGIHTGTDLLVNARENGVIIQQLPSEVFPEYYIIRVNEYDKTPESPLDEWLTYLKTGKIRQDTRTPGLQQVREKLRVLAMSPKERRAYEAHIDNIMVQNDVLSTAHYEGHAEGLAIGLAEGRAQGLAQGHAQGLVQGRTEGIASVVSNMISQGLSEEMIQKFTGLSAEDIESLRSSENPETL